MQRRIMQELVDWKDRQDRRPLVVRGARQVGKTYLVEQFAREHFQNLVSVNFDRTPEKASLLQSRDVTELVRLLEVDSGSPVVPGRTLIFLDEIQAAPEWLSISALAARVRTGKGRGLRPSLQ